MNNNNKYLIGLLLTLISIPSFSQGVIFKCIDADGNISYLNDKSSGKCNKTNLAQVDKGTIINKPSTKDNSSENKSSSELINKVPSDEQILRDQKRFIILNGELSQEKTQLKSITDMLMNVNNSKDKKQIEQLKQMEDVHKRNILALEKELGVNSKIVSTITPDSSVQLIDNPKVLNFNNPPIALPDMLPKKTISLPQNLETKLVVKPEPVIPAPLPRILMEKPLITNKSIIIPVAPIVEPIITREIMEKPLITNKSITKKIKVN